MSTKEITKKRIIHTAIRLFLCHGIKKTTMNDIALHAGITRVTVCRYFSEKKNLVGTVFLHIVSVFQKVQEDLYQEKNHDVEKYIDHIGAELSKLPKGDFPVVLEELGRIYPDILDEFHRARLSAIRKIFDRVFEVAIEQRILQEGLNKIVVRSFFTETVVKVMESPDLLALDLSAAEIYSTVKAIFLHGILKERN